VLEVVDHQQQVLGGQAALGGLIRGLAREGNNRKRLDDCTRHILGPAKRGKRHEVRIVEEVSLRRTRDSSALNRALAGRAWGRSCDAAPWLLLPSGDGALRVAWHLSALHLTVIRE